MTAKFWNKRAQRYDEKIRDHDDDFERAVLRIAALVASSDTVLDFACASGEFSLALAKRVKHVHGIDISRNMIDLAQAKLESADINTVDFSAVDIFDETLNGTSYSSILALNILHLVYDLAKTLERIHALLPEKGLLIAQTPCLGEQSWIVQTLFKFVQGVKLVPKIHDLHYKDLEIMIASTGFTILEAEVWDAKTTTNWIVAQKVS